MPGPFQEELLAWYDLNRRDLPWRGQGDPYAVWVSEIMLQQTQVATVVPYYERWMKRFPDVDALAAADPQETLAHWQGLGYYRRCRLLHQGAKFVAENGSPKSATEWRRVPGVGRYTAGAIASIALDEPVPVVDGNVLRVFARVEACSEAGPALEKAAWDWTAKVMHEKRPGDWNQALMELGATVCRPTTPECGRCPLSVYCKARRQGKEAHLPRRVAPAVPVHIEETSWVCVHEGLYGLVKIPKGQWWASMWEFPRSVRGEELRLADLAGEGATYPLGMVKYQVTRHKVQMQVHLHRCPTRSSRLTWVPEHELADLPMPAPQRRALKLAQAQGNLRR